jgi:hypothetical protein
VNTFLKGTKLGLVLLPAVGLGLTLGEPGRGFIFGRPVADVPATAGR